MKRTFATVLSLLSLLIAPAPAFALFNVNQGGTGQAAFTSGALIYGNGTNPLATTTPGTLGYVLQFNGTFPTWVSTSSLGLITHPAGNDGEIQFNESGSFASSPGLRWVPNPDPNSSELFIGNPDDPARLITARGGILTVAQVVEFSTEGIEFGDPAGSGNRMAIYNDLAPNTLSLNKASGTGGGVLSFDIDSITSFRTLTFPDLSGRVAVLEADQKWTGANTFDQGPTGTTTVNFGHMASSTSHVCFNTKNTDGAD